ncbi:trichohyalin-like [Amphibalanus amphitrite]|uniref:trichohyalin-like n=1 Tax=Amphibalanus amphitrite TaxID=1232801 RepID=UPI001C90E7E8|nr:trichohyalin-like [Amphibalanus amphitrite]
MDELDSSRSRLTDPEIISEFVLRLKQQVLGDHNVKAESLGHSRQGSTLQGQSSFPLELHQISSPGIGPTDGQASDQQVSPQLACYNEAAADHLEALQQPEPQVLNPEVQSIANHEHPQSPSSSGGSIDLCAEIMAGHALKAACREPLTASRTEGELRQAPHLHTFLINARSNMRTRLPGKVATSPESAETHPSYQEKLQLRAVERKARQQEVRRRRQEREAANREAERLRHEEFQRQLTLERQQQQEQLRQRRLRQEEQRRRQLRGQQLLQQRHQIADEFRRHALVRRVFRALVRYAQRCRDLEASAERWARSTLLSRCLHRWRHHRALLAAEREEAARDWYRTRLTAWALGRWRTYVHQQHLKAQAASDLCQLQRLQAALRTWQASLALGRVRRRQQMQRAALCDVRLTCAGVLRRWRRLPEALEQERAIEARKERLRRIVREMVPDFQPPPPTGVEQSV